MEQKDDPEVQEILRIARDLVEKYEALEPEEREALERVAKDQNLYEVVRAITSGRIPPDEGERWLEAISGELEEPRRRKGLI